MKKTIYIVGMIMLGIIGAIALFVSIMNAISVGGYLLGATDFAFTKVGLDFVSGHGDFAVIGWKWIACYIVVPFMIGATLIGDSVTALIDMIV